MSQSLFLRVVCLGFFLLLSACAQPVVSSFSATQHIAPLHSVPPSALVIRNGTVIDGTGAPPIPDGIVVITQNKIAAVGRAADFNLANAGNLIDARGGTILPGIINAHAHGTSSALVRQYYFLNHGVTSVCDLGDAITAMPRHKDNSGYKFTARGLMAGPIINVPHGYPGDGEFLYPINDPTEARAAVDDLLNRRADYIKIALDSVNSKLPWATPSPPPVPYLDVDEIQAVVDQAHRRDKLVRVHIGSDDVLTLALDGGVDALEHIPLPRLDEIAFQPNAPFAKLAPSYEAQLARMVKQRVILTPTLDYIITWCESFATDPERKQLCRQYALTPVHRFYEMGGIIALGDDTSSSNRTLMPLAEMRRLAAAGMTPMEILQAGTRTGAHVCGHGDELGTLEPGKLADVLVVNGNPLTNLDVLNQVSYVISNGQIAVSAK